MKLLILFSLLLVSCSDAPVSIDAQIKPYVNRFEVILNRHITFDIQFADIDHKYAGVCTVYFGGSRKVEISNYWWKQMGDMGKEETVFHELGHCELGRGHTSQMIGSTLQRPYSIMYPYVFGDTSYYKDNHEYYVAELFAHKEYEYLTGISTDTQNKFDGDYQQK